MAEPKKYECPICREVAILRHCGTKICKWSACQNQKCLALMDNVAGIGHYLDPQGRTNKDDGSVRRLRLIFTDGTWVERDVA